MCVCVCPFRENGKGLSKLQAPFSETGKGLLTLQAPFADSFQVVTFQVP